MNKRDAALEQVKAMRANKLADSEIRQKLMESGLSKAQTDDLVPPPPKVETPKEVVKPEDAKTILDSTINFLESLGTRTNKYADRYPDLATIRNECIGVARRLRRLV